MKNKSFNVTLDHIKLLTCLCVGYDDDTKRPYIDSKRPYGDSDIPRSVAEAIDLDFVEIEGGEMVLTSQQEKYCWKLHSEIATVLEIALSTKAFKTGEYRANEDGEWERVKLSGKK
jgi:hypothetical protein